MKKKTLFFALSLICLFLLTACQCDHEWVDADCLNAKTCQLCEEVEGEALGHDWLNATCETAKTCSRCSLTDGEPLGHEWLDATCSQAKTCTKCGDSIGYPLDHTLDEWTLISVPTLDCDGQLVQYCVVCGEQVSIKNYSFGDPDALATTISKKYFTFSPNQFMNDVILELNPQYIFTRAIDKNDQYVFINILTDGVTLATSVFTDSSNNILTEKDSDSAKVNMLGLQTHNDSSVFQKCIPVITSMIRHADPSLNEDSALAIVTGLKDTIREYSDASINLHGITYEMTVDEDTNTIWFAFYIP